MSARKILAAVSALALALLLGACAGYPVPLTAQVGSSVLIPLQGVYGSAIGYGSYTPPGYTSPDQTPLTDPQRGELIYTLTSPTPFELETRSTTLVTPYPTAKASRTGNGWPWEVVSLVDIPSGAPTGTFGFTVTHRYTDPATGATKNDNISYKGQITILPQNITFTNSAGSSQTVSGESTTLGIISCSNGVCTPQDESSTMPSYTPDPALRLSLTVPSGSNKAWGADITLSYPAGVMTVNDVIEGEWDRTTHRAVVWYNDDGSGTLTIHAAASDSQLGGIDIPFSLVNSASQILDPTSVTVTQVNAWDQDGVAIPGTTASINGIY